MPPPRSPILALFLAFPLLLGAPSVVWPQTPSVPPLPQELVETALQGRYVNGDAFAILFHKSGVVVHQGRNLSASGRWGEEDGLLCTHYDGQIVADCWQTVKVGANCYHVMTKGLKSGLGLGSRLRSLPYRLHALVWRAAEPSTCEIPAS
jgi:hypothetical protein